MLTKEEVQNIAHLARIEISEAEQEQFQVDLSKALVFFDELQSLDTEHEPEVGHITGRVNEARGDQVASTNERSHKILKENFPEEEGGYIRVKSVFEK